MKTYLRTVFAIASVAIPILYAAPAHAQATRTWVSGVGDDANPCSRTAPCKTFAGAISKTATGGEISVLDPGGFGAVTITKAITINGDGTLAGILNSLVPGIIINITTGLATDRVVLRNLSINGGGSLGTDGIRFLDGAELVVDNVNINACNDAGIDITQSQSSNVHIRNVNITRCAVGIRSQSTAGTVAGTIENVNIDGMTSHGFHAVNNTALTIRNLVSARNVGDGIRSEAASVNLVVENSTSEGNNFGVNAVAGFVRINNVGMFFNNTNLSSNVQTSGQNRSAGNTTTNNPTPGGFTIH
jgi:hypothetical protein